MDQGGDGKSPGAPDVGRWVAALVPAAVGLGLFLGLLRRMSGGLALDGQNDWNELAKVAALAAIAFGAAVLLRLVLAPLARAPGAPPPVPVDPDIAARNRIAPLVLGVGGASILVLTLVMVVALTRLVSVPGTEVGSKIDALLMGLFSAVLPILATWVGTVIAFYFTNESYRQAALATRESLTGSLAKVRVTERMIPYEKIARIERPRKDVRRIGMAEVFGMMHEPVTRVIVFEENVRNPVFILRRSLIPQAWLTPDDKQLTDEAKQKTVDDYLRISDRAASDATLFTSIASSATIDEARLAMRLAGCADVFVNATGQKTEPVLGWLTDDILMQP